MKKYILSIILAITLTFVGAGFAFAQTNNQAPGHFGGLGWGRMGGGPGIFGTVSAVSGTNLTVTSKIGPRQDTTTSDSTSTSTKTYTVDASNATVMKNGATSSVSDIAVGDNVMIQGTIDGTNIVAKNIRDGVTPWGPGQRAGWGEQQIPIQGNGQPIVAGKVTSINGNSITITNGSNVTYVVDASNAKIVKRGSVSGIGSVAVGDELVVQGTVNGSSITATSVIDRGTPPTIPVANQNSNTANGNTQAPHKGFFGWVGDFFGKLFGF